MSKKQIPRGGVIAVPLSAKEAVDFFTAMALISARRIIIHRMAKNLFPVLVSIKRPVLGRPGKFKRLHTATKLLNHLSRFSYSLALIQEYGKKQEEEALKRRVIMEAKAREAVAIKALTEETNRYLSTRKEEYCERRLNRFLYVAGKPVNPNSPTRFKYLYEGEKRRSMFASHFGMYQQSLESIKENGGYAQYRL